MQEIIHILSIAACFFGVIISIVIFFLRRADQGNKFLGAYLLLLTLCLAEPVTSVYLTSLPFTLLLLGSLNFLLGPALYFYCLFRTREPGDQKRNFIPHLFPFLGYSLLLIVYPSIKAKISTGQLELLEVFFYEFFFIQFFIYGIKSLRLTGRIKKKDTSRKVIHSFLKVLTITSLLIFLTSFIGNHIYLLSGLQQSSAFHTLIQVLLMFSLTLFVLLNTESMNLDKLVPMD